MPKALVTTEPNQERTIVVSDYAYPEGEFEMAYCGKNFHLFGVWQWLAWNRLKFLSKLSLKLATRDRRLQERRQERESRRSFIKHRKHRCHEFVLAALILLWTAETRQNSYRAYLLQICPRPSNAQILKPPPTFLKGLSGFARTDSTAPADFF
jgi:hypothetical protein